MTIGLIPRHAERLLALRLDGKDPDELVIVSLDGLQSEYIDNYQMVCNINKKYDWRILAGLEVCLLVRTSMPGLIDFMLDMAKGVKPGRLYMWDIDSHMGATLYALPDADTIDRPEGAWKWHLDYLPWLPLQNERFLSGPPRLHDGLERHGLSTSISTTNRLVR